MLLRAASRRALGAAIVLALACAHGGRRATADCEPGQNAVSWQRALELLEAGEIVGGGQTHSGHVFLELRDGRSLVTVQPGIDQIFREIERRAPNKHEIQFWTE